MGGNGAVFIEGDSEVIAEVDEQNISLDQVKRKSVFKNNKSLDDFDGENEEQPVS
jgi:hypothetical protein